MPYRDPKTGLCVEADINEPGEAVGANVPGFTIPKSYLKNDKANEKRFLRDVFEKGDTWERSGDLFKRDENGLIYFIERIGDTFRWKGTLGGRWEVGKENALYQTANVELN